MVVSSVGGHKESGSTGLHAVSGKFKGHLPAKLKVVSLENYYLYWKGCEGVFFYTYWWSTYLEALSSLHGFLGFYYVAFLISL